MLPPFRRAPRALALVATCTAFALSGCLSSEDPDLVVYVVMDQIHSEDIIRRFEEETGLDVRAEYDVESNKTIGMVARLRAEASAPRCDVFWNNEPAHTMALAEEGLFEVYRSPNAADIPAHFKDPEGRWTGFAARARCLIINTELTPADQRPDELFDLVDPAFAGTGAFVRPLTGSTLTHMAVLYTLLGPERAREFAAELVELNAADKLDLPAGNGPLMTQVGLGEIAWGWTDTDDFNVGLQKGYPVERVFADQGPDAMGTLVFPNTVSQVANGPNPENAKRFIDFMLSHEVERLLAEADSAQIPTRDSIPRPETVASFDGVRVMQVDWVEVAAVLDEVHGELKELFLR
jgi:iron(III) transport system substrate-binding protein